MESAEDRSGSAADEVHDGSDDDECFMLIRWSRSLLGVMMKKRCDLDSTDARARPEVGERPIVLYPMPTSLSTQRAMGSEGSKRSVARKEVDIRNWLMASDGGDSPFPGLSGQS